jgi:3-oxoadipate enol-lactonase
VRIVSVIRKKASHQEPVRPWLPASQIVTVEDRGEFFVRRFQHSNPSAPTLLLLHGWTGCADTNFFTAYPQLAEKYSFVAMDHRGHGRGLRSQARFTLEDCADDAAVVLKQLDIDKVVVVGYSMGGPVGMLLWRRHPHLVASVVLCATALEWCASRSERNRWRVGRLMAPVFRVVSTPAVISQVVRRAMGRKNELAPLRPWIVAEARRNDAWSINQAGQALSRYDAREWARSIDVPVAVVVTTKDTLVPPHKQHALAGATAAHVVSLDADHMAVINAPEKFATALRIAVDHVAFVGK